MFGLFYRRIIRLSKRWQCSVCGCWRTVGPTAVNIVYWSSEINVSIEIYSLEEYRDYLLFKYYHARSLSSTKTLIFVLFPLVFFGTRKDKHEETSARACWCRFGTKKNPFNLTLTYPLPHAHPRPHSHCAPSSARSCLSFLVFIFPAAICLKIRIFLLIIWRWLKWREFLCIQESLFVFVCFQQLVTATTIYI
jgi:hypothetical protein